jgi:PKD repeat protein
MDSDTAKIILLIMLITGAVLVLSIPIVDASEVPSANFTANQTSGNTPLAVQFTNTSTGDNITIVGWDFGDGSDNSTEANPVHQYTTGTYNVTLTVSNLAGTSTMQIVNMIHVERGPNPTPTPTPTGRPLPTDEDEDDGLDDDPLPIWIGGAFTTIMTLVITLSRRKE